MYSIILSGCAIIQEEKLLLLWKIKREHYEFPGGKVEQGEILEQTAIRETKEEIGCTVDIVKYLGYIEFFIDGKLFQSHNYLAKIAKNQKPYVAEPDTFRDVFWLPIHEFKQYSIAPNVKLFCEQYLSGKYDI
ncbi:MAG: NUDIX hydrolase [Nanoarchaeota archaeon]